MMDKIKNNKRNAYCNGKTKMQNAKMHANKLGKSSARWPKKRLINFIYHDAVVGSILERAADQCSDLVVLQLKVS